MAWVRNAFEQVSPRSTGIVAIVLAVFLLSFSDALVKLSGDRFGLGQIVLLRSLVAGGLIGAGLLAMFGPSALGLPRARWVWARSLSLTGMWLCYYAALPTMSFALAAACYYTSPIWMALMARFWLGNAIGMAGWVAIGLTCVGVVLAVNPASGELTFAVLLPLAAAAFYALAGTITWSRCQNETAGTMAFNLNLCLVIIATIGLGGLWFFQPDTDGGFVLAIWPSLRTSDWTLALLLGFLLAIIATLVALAYRLAPTPVVGVFDTSYLGFAALWSAVIFADPPALCEGSGIVLIVTGGILMNRRSTARN